MSATGRPRVVRALPEPEALARAAAEEVAGRLEAAARARGLATIALSGGSTPRALHALLTAEDGPFRARIPWTATHFFWGDERHVPPDHPDSNYRMAWETLLSRVPVAATQVHRIPAEMPDADAAARAYEAELRDVFGARGLLAEGRPRFDLVLLGMGADGHTASLFPGTAVVHETGRWVAAPWVPKLDAHRITLTPPVLNAAAAVLFLVAGQDKAETLRAVLEGPILPDRFPSQGVAPTDGDLVWLVDQAAAARLGAIG